VQDVASLHLHHGRPNRSWDVLAELAHKEHAGARREGEVHLQAAQHAPPRGVQAQRADEAEHEAQHHRPHPGAVQGGGECSAVPVAEVDGGPDSADDQGDPGGNPETPDAHLARHRCPAGPASIQDLTSSRAASGSVDVMVHVAPARCVASGSG
jgi:hypothetical protein